MFKNVRNNDFIDIVKNRRSIRVYDTDHKIPEREMNEMLEEAFRAPSWVNFQPWRVVVVESAEGKEKLLPLVRFNKRQSRTSSAMLLVFGDLRAEQYGEKIYGKAVAEGKMNKKVKEQQLKALEEMYDDLTVKERNDIVRVDAGVWAMQFMLVARAHGYDTSPIGGFERDKLADVFDMDPERYVPAVIISVGKAAEVGYETVRLGTDEFVRRV